MQLNIYLSFDGDCREAFGFYQRQLGGEIQAMMTWGESPMADQVPEGSRDLIMHASLQIDGQTLMGADAGPPQPYEGVKGAAVTINVEDTDEAARLFGGLSEGGDVQMPLQETFWAKRFGMFTDRFGVPWMINCSKEEPT